MATSTNHITQLSENVTLQRLHDGKLLIFEVQDYSDDVVDVLIGVVHEHAAYCIEHKIPYLTMYCSDKFYPPTIYHRGKIEECGKSYPTLKGRDVVVVPASPLMALMRILIPLLRFHQRGIERRIMRDREKAIAWLSELL